MHERRLGAAGLWGIAGVLAILLQAVVKLFPLALDLRDRDLTLTELAILGGWLVVSAYSEGYKGFQKQFSPRVVARAQYLSANPRPLLVALAPIFCMGLIHATRKRLIISWVLTLAIAAVVIVVRQLDQPWRGIIDAGVVVGLSWGIVAIIAYAIRGSRGEAMPVSPDVPESR